MAVADTDGAVMRCGLHSNACVKERKNYSGHTMGFRWVALLIIVMSNVLLAQVEGEIESIGLGTFYRPECWVPMRVVLHATGDEARELQLRVIQEDLDYDRVVCVKEITLTPDTTGQANRQRFWMYFRPQASGKGLQDNSLPGGGGKRLEQQLKVVIADSHGKVIATLPNTQQTLRRADMDLNRENEVQGVRVVLCVSDGRSLPAVNAYEFPMTGISERPLFVTVRPDDLPEDVRGYEMVDAIVWMGANAPDPNRPAEQPRFRAIEQYVKQGGSLVVCQSAELNQTRGLQSILPVQVTDSVDTSGLEPLVEMGRLDGRTLGEEASQVRRVAVATPKPGALVLRSKQVAQASIPFLVRGRLGAGCVTWVAQDLGESSTVRSLRSGWVWIWDEVMGWRNSPTQLTDKEIKENAASAFTQGHYMAVDMGRAFRPSGALGSRAAGYVLLAVVFFIVYWFVAGPGLYGYLSLRKLATLNWSLFGVMAVAASMLALLVVRFIQSGTPELDHVTVVRAAAGEPATMDSRVSLLVRSDGLKKLALAAGASHAVSWITPYPEHPDVNRDEANRFLAMRQYDLKISDAANDEAVSVAIPWRSTSKRLQLRWTGDLDGRVVGHPALTGRRIPEIDGTLGNGTGRDLREVYIVYRAPSTQGDGENGPGDRILYLPRWPKDQSIDLGQILANQSLARIGKDRRMQEAMPREDLPVFGTVEAVHRPFGSTEVVPGEGWAAFWYSKSYVGSGFGLDAMNDAGDGYVASLPLCSLFERVPPMRNRRKDGGGWEEDRRQILRIGERWMDVSPAVAAGNLVVLAQAQGELPVPLEVEGEKVNGRGTILYQFILPMNRGQ